MIADIPSLFSDIVDGKPAIPQELHWVFEKGTEFYLQWYGKPVKIIGGITHRWDGKWVPCEEKNDVLYTDARNCADAVSFFQDQSTNKLPDGYYWLVGDFADNPYGFRMPMLIPADCFKVNFDKSITIDGFKEFFMLQPNIFGIVLENQGRWAQVDGHAVGLDFKYNDGKEVPEVRKDTDKKTS